MEALFQNGRVVDAILALMIAEAMAVLGWRAWRGNGPHAVPFVANLVAGAMLLLALRAMLVGADVRTLALWLLAAFVAHLVDLRLRWRTDDGTLPRANARGTPWLTQVAPFSIAFRRPTICGGSRKPICRNSPPKCARR